MKVYEILSESRVLTEETLWSMIFRATTRGGGAVVDILRAISSEVKMGTRPAKDLAEAWVAAARGGAKDIEEIIKSGEKIAQDAGVERAAIEAAKKEARASMKTLADYDKFVLPLGEKIPNWLPTLITTLGIAEPIYKYFERMAEWQKQGLTPEKLEEHKRIELGILATEMAALFVGGKVINAAGGVTKFLSKVLPDRPYAAIVAIIDKITKPAAKAALATWLASDQGRTWLATTTLGGLTELMSATSVSNRVELFNQMGGWMQNIYNVLTNATKELVDTVSGNTTTDTPGTAADDNTPLSPEEMKKYGLTPQQKTQFDANPDRYIPPGMARGADNRLKYVPVDTSRYYNK